MVAWRRARSDLIHARVPRGFVRDVFEVMTSTPRHAFQILTKRSRRLRHLAAELTWPPNVWMGVSVETPDQQATGSRTVTKFDPPQHTCSAETSARVSPSRNADT
jgi:protein gp37